MSTEDDVPSIIRMHWPIDREDVPVECPTCEMWGTVDEHRYFCQKEACPYAARETKPER